MDDDFYKRCVACFDDEVELLKCKRCVYHICKHCIVDMAKVNVKLCKESKCRYDYLEEGEECHCYVCSTKTTDIVFNCPTCSLERTYLIKDFDEEIKERIRYHKKGLKKFCSADSKLDGYGIVYFTIMDLDTGETELLSFRSGPYKRDSIII